MSFFGKLFSGKKGEPAPTPSEAIQKLRDIENMLTKKQEFLEKKIDVELETAKKHGTKNKRGKILDKHSKHQFIWFEGQLPYAMTNTLIYIVSFSVYVSYVVQLHYKL